MDSPISAMTFWKPKPNSATAVANQVRRETEWLGRKAAARTRKASSRIEAAMDRREELAELNYRTAASNSAGIDFAEPGAQTSETRDRAGCRQVAWRAFTLRRHRPHPRPRHQARSARSERKRQARSSAFWASNSTQTREKSHTRTACVW